MANRDELVRYCNELLNADQYRDIALNGLQIEGKSEIRHISVAVSCNQRTIDVALESNADAMLVHHGLVLNGQVGDIRGPVRQRLKAILANDINLIAYHIPLDGHPEIGNNARIIAEMELNPLEPLDVFGPVPVGYIAEAPDPLTLTEVASRFERVTGQSAVTLPGGPDYVTRLAVLSGSGYPALEEAAAKGCDVLLTGDAREPTMAMARELGITVLVGGHEATERLGVQALAEKLQVEFGVDFEFVADPNPL